MKRIKQQLVIYLLILTGICHINAQQEEAVFINYQEKVQTWLKSHKVPAVGIGVIEEGKLGQIMVFGDLKNHDHAP